MAKEKLKLDALQIDSFATSLDGEQLKDVKGGVLKFTVPGKKSDYSVRWTTLDTRIDPDAKAQSIKNKP